MPKSETRAPAVCSVLSLLAAALALAGCAQNPDPSLAVLRLAASTSTVDTGLLGSILPAFEAQCACRVEVVAAGTGQALAAGRRGDADVLIVHAPEQEAVFQRDGHAARRDDVMYNDFVIVGPADTFVVPETRRAVVLAHERDGRAMTGREGLIQLVVGADEFASRYSHWVSEVRVH